jgi:hypothetical protein
MGCIAKGRMNINNMMIFIIYALFTYHCCGKVQPYINSKLVTIKIG